MATVQQFTIRVVCDDFSEYTRLLDNLTAGHIPSVVSYVTDEGNIAFDLTIAQMVVHVPVN